jgi:glycosyltransferase involved in cell wall biosynthesis
MDSVLFVVRGDATIPSCRFRAYQFAEPLRELGVAAEFFVEGRRESAWDWIRTTSRLVGRVAKNPYRAVVYMKRLQPERIFLMRMLNRNVWYDFDDAVYLGHGFRFGQSVRAAGGVIAGNEELAQRARRHGARVEVIPTAVEVPEKYQIPDLDGPLYISWMGTAGNLHYLEPVLEAVDSIRRDGVRAVLHVLTEQPERVPQKAGVVAESWSPEAEQKTLSRCHLGVMPLSDDAWSRGKCACKALQYLSYARPVVCSPVGINIPLFENKAFGRLATDTRDWIDVFKTWNSSREDMVRVGLLGREFVEEQYSVQRWARTLRDLLLGEESV